MATTVTRLHMAPQYRRAAVLHGAQHLPLRRSRPVGSQIFVGMLPKHIRHFELRGVHGFACASSALPFVWFATSKSNGLLVWLISLLETWV